MCICLPGWQWHVRENAGGPTGSLPLPLTPSVLEGCCSTSSLRDTSFTQATSSDWSVRTPPASWEKTRGRAINDSFWRFSTGGNLLI
ncbi:unnamed protein product [Larinioides sclopetarius]|uniref:Uncharacterized protein n=1 Tax=Larinioides sclopetarius TaxID=280406 RepID=A0AAV1ZKI5_9ARAC